MQESKKSYELPLPVCHKLLDSSLSHLLPHPPDLRKVHLPLSPAGRDPHGLHGLRRPKHGLLVVGGQDGQRRTAGRGHRSQQRQRRTIVGGKSPFSSAAKPTDQGVVVAAAAGTTQKVCSRVQAKFLSMSSPVQFLEVCSTHFSEHTFEHCTWVLIYTIYPNVLNAPSKEPTSAGQ